MNLSPLEQPSPFSRVFRSCKLSAQLLAAAGVMMPALLFAQLELDKAFIAPPFVLDETVVDKEGWEMTYAADSRIYTDPNAARLITTPLNDSGQETTLSLQTAIKNERIANPGNLFTIEAQLAVTYNHQHRLGGSVYFQFFRDRSISPLHFGFAYADRDEPGGLYYSGKDGRVLVIRQEEMVENGPYRFVIRVDTASERFTVEVTGKDMNGDAFRYQSEEVEFQENYRSLSGGTISLFIGNERPTLVEAYIDYVKIAQQ